MCPPAQTGLGLLRQAGAVLQCYTDIHDAIWHAELGSSKAILDAGYSIDSLMLRYQGVDWRDKANWGCNAGWVGGWGAGPGRAGGRLGGCGVWPGWRVLLLRYWAVVPLPACSCY